MKGENKRKEDILIFKNKVPVLNQQIYTYLTCKLFRLFEKRNDQDSLMLLQRWEGHVIRERERQVILMDPCINDPAS